MTKNKIKQSNSKNKSCGPKFEYKDGSCIPLDLLIKMAEKYNTTYKDRIKLDEKANTINPSLYKKYLIGEFEKKFKNICEEQKCWLRQKFMYDLIKEYKKDIKSIFRPDGPSNSVEWLSTYDINNVLKQYQDIHKNFKFLNTVPCDFQDIDELCIQDEQLYNFYKKKYDKYGIVFNTDPSYKSGSHWVALYFCISKKQIYFFDSYGVRPQKEFRDFMKKICKFMINYLNFDKKDIDIRHNKLRHQYSDSECGVYSINFIIRMLNNKKFDEITSRRIPDKLVTSCRKVYFY